MVESTVLVLASQSHQKAGHINHVQQRTLMRETMSVFELSSGAKRLPGGIITTTGSHCIELLIVTQTMFDSDLLQQLLSQQTVGYMTPLSHLPPQI